MRKVVSSQPKYSNLKKMIDNVQTTNNNQSQFEEDFQFLISGANKDSKEYEEARKRSLQYLDEHFPRKK